LHFDCWLHAQRSDFNTNLLQEAVEQLALKCDRPGAGERRTPRLASLAGEGGAMSEDQFNPFFSGKNPFVEMLLCPCGGKPAIACCSPKVGVYCPRCERFIEVRGFSVSSDFLAEMWNQLVEQQT
jgi:hypothetical protein